MNRADQERYARWARVNLGIPRSEFNTLTLQDFVHLVELWKEKERILDLRTARICHTIAGALGAKQEDNSPIPLAFFMPGYKGPKQKSKKQTVNQMVSTLIGLAKARGVEVVDMRKKKHG